jgi:cation diffusion facilitator family transporter
MARPVPSAPLPPPETAGRAAAPGSPASAGAQAWNPAANALEKRDVARNSMTAAAVMTLLKLAAGLLSGSLGVLSDAAHSGLDLAGATLTFFSVRVSDKPADEDHTYGHGKVENLSAFTEAGIMALSCVWIVWEALRRIFGHTVELHHSVWPIAVLLTSICVDYWRSHQLRRVALRTGSPALATDASHFASDIWASVAVLAGLATTWMGERAGIGWLRYADPVAAILVSAMIVRMTIQLGKDAVGVLLDEIPAETRTRLIREVELVPGVLAVEQARVRRAGAGYFADLTLALPRRSTFEHTEGLVKAATAAVQRALPRADVVIRTVPREANAENIFDLIRAVAARNNVSVHELSVQSHQGRLRVEQHVELDENLSLLAAHDFVTALETEILRATPEIDAILTHIESEPATIEQPEEILESDRRIEQSLREAAAAFPEIVDVHQITVGRIGEHVSVACHCTLPDNLVLQNVHVIITALEDRFKLACPEVQRVTIHPEPVTDNRR